MDKISGEDKFNITQSWTEISKNMDRNGALLHELMFRAHPSTLQLFSYARDKSLEEAISDARHFDVGRVTMVKFGNYVLYLDNPPALMAEIKSVGLSHKPRGIDQSHYEKMRSVFKTFMEIVMGAKFSQDTWASWDRFFKLHNACL